MFPRKNDNDWVFRIMAKIWKQVVEFDMSCMDVRSGGI